MDPSRREAVRRFGSQRGRDGVEGTRRRMAVARRYVPDFGIASECGISRGRDANVARDYLRVYAGAAEAGASAG